MSGIVDQVLNGVVKGALSEILTKTGIRKTRRARRTKSTGSLAGGIVGSVLEAAINAAIKPKPAKSRLRQRTAAEPETLTDSVMARIQNGMSQLGLNHDSGPKPPAMLDVLASSINIMQVLITRSRLAGEPADVMVTPLLADLGLMEFHRGDVAIDAGRRAVEGAMPELQRRLKG